MDVGEPAWAQDPQTTHWQGGQGTCAAQAVPRALHIAVSATYGEDVSLAWSEWKESSTDLCTSFALLSAGVIVCFEELVLIWYMLQLQVFPAICAPAGQF